MKIFRRESAKAHCRGMEWPDFLGKVNLGESFIVETESEAPNGPIEIAGIKAGDDIAVHIEKIEMLGPFIAPNGGPFFDGCGPGVELEYKNGYFYWPGNFRLKAAPSIGNIAVLPAPTPGVLELSKEYKVNGERFKNESAWRRVVRGVRHKHCHQDCGALAEGAIIHMKAQVDGAGLCIDDIHGYIGAGEMAFGGIEIKANVRVRAERSTGWFIDWPVIETAHEIMVFIGYSRDFEDAHGRSRMEYVDIIREAYKAVREVVAKKINGSIEEANSIVATAVDIRNCALYGMEGFISKKDSPCTQELAVTACLPKDVFDLRK